MSYKYFITCYNKNDPQSNIGCEELMAKYGYDSFCVDSSNKINLSPRLWRGRIITEKPITKKELEEQFSYLTIITLEQKNK